MGSFNDLSANVYKKIYNLSHYKIVQYIIDIKTWVPKL